MNEKLKRKLFDLIEGDFNYNKKKKFVGFNPLKNKNNFNNNSNFSFNDNNDNQSKLNELKYNSFKQIKPSQEIYLNSYENDANILNIINNYSSRNKKFYSNYFNNNSKNKNYCNSTTNNNKNKINSKYKSNLNLFHHKQPIQKIFDFTNELKTIQIENRKKISSPNKNFINSNKISFPLNLRKKKFLTNGAYVTNIFNDHENPFKIFSKSKKKKNFLSDNENSIELKKKEKKEKIEKFKEGFNFHSNDIEKYLKKEKKKKINLNLNINF